MATQIEVVLVDKAGSGKPQSSAQDKPVDAELVKGPPGQATTQPTTAATSTPATQPTAAPNVTSTQPQQEGQHSYRGLTRALTDLVQTLLPVRQIFDRVLRIIRPLTNVAQHAIPEPIRQQVRDWFSLRPTNPQSQAPTTTAPAPPEPPVQGPGLAKPPIVAPPVTAAAPATESAAAATVGGMTAATGVGVVVAGAVVAITAFVAALYAAVKSIKGVGDEIEEYSGAVAAVRAEHEAEMIKAQLGRADRLGEGVSQVDAARGRIELSMYEVQTSIYELLLKFAPQIQVVLDLINVGVRGVDSQVDLLKILIDVSTLNWQNVPGDLKEAKASSIAFVDALEEVLGPTNSTNGSVNSMIDGILGVRQPLP